MRELADGRGCGGRGLRLVSRIEGWGASRIVNLRTLIGGLVGCVIASGSALARDFIPVVPAGSAPSWAGYYLGLQAGGVFGSADGDYTGGIIPPPPPPAPPMVYYPFSLDLNGGVLGGSFGYNFVNGPWLFGLSGDLNWIIGAEDRYVDPVTGRWDQVELQWMAHLLGRIGYMFNPYMIYLTGGAAFAGVHATHSAPPNLWFDTRVLTGYSIGGGIEAFLAGNWILRIQYLHDSFSSEHYDWVVGSRYSNSDLTTDTVTVGLVFKPY